MVEMAKHLAKQSSMDRIIAYIDVDCFSVQEHLKDKSHLRCEPCIAVQPVSHNTNPRIVSVNAIAKGFGITRDDRLFSAKKKCPNVVVFEQENKYNKTWTQNEDKSSLKILDVIKDYSKNFTFGEVIIDRNSNDSFILDITDICRQYSRLFSNEELLGLKVFDNGKRFCINSRSVVHNRRLAFAAWFSRKICDEIKSKTTFETSIGISYNILMAKIGCELNKPNNITLIHTQKGVERVMSYIPVQQLPGFKKDFGRRVCYELGISMASEMKDFSERKLIQMYGQKDGQKVWNTCRGIDDTSVSTRYMFKGVTNSRKFFKGINLKDNLQDLYTECNAFEDKIKFDCIRNNRIVHKYTVKFMDREGKTLFSTEPIEYVFTTVYKEVKALAKPVLKDTPIYKIIFMSNGLDAEEEDEEEKQLQRMSAQWFWEEFVDNKKKIDQMLDDMERKGYLIFEDN